MKTTNLEVADKMEKNLNGLAKLGVQMIGDEIGEKGIGNFAADDPRSAALLMGIAKTLKDSIDMMRTQAETLDYLTEKMGSMEKSLKELKESLSKLAPAESK